MSNKRRPQKKVKPANKVQPADKSRQVKKSQVQKKQNAKRLWIYITAALVLVVIGVIALTNKQGELTALPLDISVDQAADLREDGAFVLDVRTKEEWDEFHIPDSTLIPLDQLLNRLGEVPTDQQIIVVCRTGNRSQAGRDMLINAGIVNVASMTGGVSEWRDLGYPIVTGP